MLNKLKGNSTIYDAQTVGKAISYEADHISSSPLHYMPDQNMSKQVIKVAFIGGGKGCFDILNLLKSYSLVHIQPQVIGVADTNKDALGRKLAEHLGLPTTSDYTDFLHNKEIDLIIELTGDNRVLEEIQQHKLESIKVLDHVGALFLWEIIAIQKEKLRLEKKVSDLDTMAAIGEISYRLTHELRNPLMIVGGLVRRMMTRIDLPHGIRKRLKHISSHVGHIEDVISDICDVVRPLRPNYQLINMNDFLENWCNAAVTEARIVGVSVNVSIEKNLPTMYIDPSLIRQALWHILENSLDAMVETKGDISITTLLCWDNIHIELRDTGSGFSDLPATKAVHPFMTTRPGKMGLGLALCRQIVLDHGGHIEFFSDKNGATVIIELPITFDRPAQ